MCRTGIRGPGLIQPGQVESRQDMMDVVSVHEVPDWGRIDPCWPDTMLRQER